MLWAGIFCLGAGLNIPLGWHGWPAVFAGSLPDPDSYMRLERLRQGIALGHLTNFVARDGPGAGTLIEWSRLYDAALWAIALPIAPFTGWTRALFAAGIISVPVSVGCLGMALAFAARPFAEDRLLWSAAVAAALLPGLATLAIPGAVHFHVALLALVALTAGFTARAWRLASGQAFMAGLSGGLAIWLTPETMPFILMIFALLLARWATGPRAMDAVLTAAAAGFFDILGFGLAIDPPAGGYAVPEIDRLSLVYAGLAILLLGAAGLLSRLHRWNAGRRVPIGIALMAAIVIGWIAIFPGVALGPYGLMSHADMQKFFGLMAETQPLHGWPQIGSVLLPGIVALLYTLWRAAMAPGQSRWLWLYGAFVTFVTLGLGYRFLLLASFSATIAAGLLPVAVSEAGRRLNGVPLGQAMTRIAVLAVFILLPVIPLLATKAAPPAAAAPSCDLRNIGRLLAPDAGKTVLAPVEATPELLYRSKILTVGSLYQHGLPGYFAARDAWRGTPGTTIPPAVAATRASEILFCPRPQRYILVRDLPPDTLWDALNANHPPPWLTRQATDPGTGWEVFTIGRNRLPGA